MIIEFTGCSGAGKSVLREAVVQELAQRGQQARCPLTAVLSPRLARVRSWPRLGNLLLDLAIMPKFLATQTVTTDP